MRRAFTGLFVFVVLVSGCKRGPTGDGPAQQGPAVGGGLEETDPHMKAAMEKSRLTVGDFINALKKPSPKQTGFAVKLALSDGTNTEHAWIAPVTYDGSKFTGPISVAPALVTNVQIGNKLSVEPNKILDWMYIDDRKLVGGYTYRAVREVLPPAERDNFDRSMPFVITD